MTSANVSFFLFFSETPPRSGPVRYLLLFVLYIHYCRTSWPALEAILGLFLWQCRTCSPTSQPASLQAWSSRASSSEPTNHAISMTATKTSQARALGPRQCGAMAGGSLMYIHCTGFHDAGVSSQSDRTQRQCNPSSLASRVQRSSSVRQCPSTTLRTLPSINTHAHAP